MGRRVKYTDEFKLRWVNLFLNTKRYQTKTPNDFSLGVFYPLISK